MIWKKRKYSIPMVLRNGKKGLSLIVIYATQEVKPLPFNSLLIHLKDTILNASGMSHSTKQKIFYIGKSQ